MEDWLKKAHERINSEALYAYESCRIVAANERIDLDYVVEVFLQEFRKAANKGGNK